MKLCIKSHINLSHIQMNKSLFTHILINYRVLTLSPFDSPLCSLFLQVTWIGIIMKLLKSLETTPSLST